MKVVNVKASGKYDVTIGQNLDFADMIKKITDSRRTVVVSDDIVWDLYGEQFCENLIGNGISCSIFVMRNGEESKTLDTVNEITECFSDFELTRTDFAIELGGGVVGDCCGFASSIYLRGIDFIQIPTTFLAAIDSSVGGKTGVNTEYGKNLLGAFHQPIGVFCDTEFFNTLPDEIFTAGCCEALKYGVLKSEKLFDKIEDTKDNIEEIVYECVKIKADIVCEDEFDKGERQLLNLGHTFGHSIEKISNFNISHGHAVGLGMIIASAIAESSDLCEKGVSEKIRTKLVKMNVNTDLSRFDIDEIYETALSDKKRKGNEISLVLPKKIGECFLYKTEIANVRELLKRGLK